MRAIAKRRACQVAAFAAMLWLIPLGQAHAQISWTDWITGGPSVMTATGSMNIGGTTVGVTFTGPMSSPTNLGAPGETDYWRTGGTPWPAYDAVNAPTGTDMIGISSQATYTMTFSQSVTGLFMAFVSIGRLDLPVTYDFDRGFDIVDQGAGHWDPYGNGSLTESGDGTLLIGDEGHGVIRFDGEVSSLQFTTTPGEYWHGFNVGATTVTPEPGTWLLLATGLVGVAGMARARRRRS